jgi:hypothetical protein
MAVMKGRVGLSKSLPPYISTPALAEINKKAATSFYTGKKFSEKVRRRLHPSLTPRAGPGDEYPGI